MDAKSFCSYLKNELAKESKIYDDNLLSSNYSTIEETKRAGGIRYALVSVAESLDRILADFHIKNNGAPASSDMSVSPQLPGE